MSPDGALVRRRRTDCPSTGSGLAASSAERPQAPPVGVQGAPISSRYRDFGIGPGNDTAPRSAASSEVDLFPGAMWEAPRVSLPWWGMNECSSSIKRHSGMQDLSPELSGGRAYVHNRTKVRTALRDRSRATVRQSRKRLRAVRSPSWPLPKRHVCSVQDSPSDASGCPQSTIGWTS